MKTTKLESLLEKPTKALMTRWLTAYKSDLHFSRADELQRRLAETFAGDYESILAAVVFLNPDDYPIFDSHVEQMLKAYNRKFGFCTGRAGNLRDYTVFKDWVRSFIEYFGLECTFWESDKFMWTYYNSLQADNKR